MIIRSFSIDRFGVLSGQEVPSLGPGLNIFLGDNEAGKSTLLNFFRAMFFGYKRGNKNALDYLAAGTDSALAGGSLALTSGRGTAFNLIRRPGKHGGELTLSDEAGRPLPASFLAELFSGYTDKMYDQVFCFGHNDLASLAGMSDEAVAGALHAAAFGTGFKSPLEVSRALLDKQKKIYAPKASSTPIYKDFKRLGEIKAELARLGSELGRYAGLKDERALIAAEQEALKVKNLELSLALAQKQSLAGAWDDWSALGETRAALGLNLHPGGEFGIESIERFDEMVATLESRLAERREKQALLQAWREELAGGAALAPLAGIWPDCRNLLARKDSLQKAEAALPRLEAALLEARERQSGLAQSLGAEWSLERAAAFEPTLPFQEGAELGRQSLDEARNALKQAEAEAVSLEDDAREAREAAAAIRHSFGQSGEFLGNEAVTVALYSPEGRVRLESCAQELAEALRAEAELYARASALEDEEAEAREALDEIRARLDAAQNAVAEAEAARAARKAPLFSLATAREDSRRVPWLLLCLVLALLCFSGTYKYFDVTVLGQTSWQKFTSPEAWKLYLQYNWLTFGLGLAFLWGAFYWLAPRAATLGRWHPAGPGAEALSPEEGAARSRADALAGELAAQEAQLARMCARLERLREAAQEAAGAVRKARGIWAGQASLYSIDGDCPPEGALRIFDSALLAARAGTRAAKAEDAAGKAATKLQEAVDSWRDWLEGHGFSRDYTPDMLRLALERIQQIKEQAAAVSAREAEIGAARDEVSSFGAELEALYARSGFTCDLAGLVARFDAIYKASWQAYEKSMELKARARELEKLEAELLSLEELVKAQQKRLGELMEQAEAADEADYRLRFKRQAAHAALRAEEERLLARLEQAAGQLHAPSGRGLWSGLDEFLAALAAGGREALEAESAALKEELAALEVDLAQKHNRQGEIKALLDGLESGRAGAGLQAEESALKEELREYAREWGVAVLARVFVSRARKSFEEDRHDSVIRQAGEILGALTGGRYKQMLFDLGGKDFKAYAITGAGERMDSETSLSQGTREQLYLALRLAFIRQHNLTKESLPLIMDDILVNFDPGRARNAAEIFTAFSAENQGLFFTCHPHTAALLRDLAPGASCYSIQAGRISPMD